MAFMSFVLVFRGWYGWKNMHPPMNPVYENVLIQIIRICISFRAGYSICRSFPRQ